MQFRFFSASKSLFTLGVLAASLTFIPNSQAGKHMLGPWTVSDGSVSVQAGLGSKEAIRSKFSPDYSVSGGGIELPIEQDLQNGDTVVLSNTTSGDKAKDAKLIVERTAAGGVFIRLEIFDENFNYERCEGGGEDEHRKVCFPEGLAVKNPGATQATIAKINLNEGLAIHAKYGQARYRLSADGGKHTIDNDTAIQLLLPPGKSLSIKIESAAAHKAMQGSGQLLYHLAEKIGGPALGQTKIIGELSYSTNGLDVDSQGNTDIKRTLKPGDVIRISGGKDGEDFVFNAIESNQGSLLKIARISPDRPLKKIQVNEEAPMSLGEDTVVSINSSGGQAGFQLSGDTQQYGLKDGVTTFVQAGGSVKLNLFTTLEQHGQNFAPNTDKPGFGGPSDLATPVFPPDPDPDPADETEEPLPPDEDSGKVEAPKVSGFGETKADGGWTCSLQAHRRAKNSVDLMSLLLAAPILLRLRKHISF